MKKIAEQMELLDQTVEEKEQIRDEFCKGNIEAVQTLNDWEYLWIREILPNAVKEQTRLMYGTTMDRHILPYIGALKLADLTVERIEQWTDTLKTKEVPFTMDGKMTEATVRNTVSVLSGCLRDAQKCGLLKENPCVEAAEAIKVRNIYEENEWLTKEEIQKLQLGFMEYKVQNGYPIGVAYELILYTGVSLSEVLALKWKNISESTGMLQVRAVVLFKDDGLKEIIEEYELQGRRRRDIPVPERLMKRLQDIRIQYQRSDEDYVISQTGRNLLHQDRFRSHLMRYSKKNLKRVVTPRMLRDTYAVYALQAGADSDTVAELLGYYSSRQIIRRYMPRKAIDKKKIVERMYEQ